MARTIIRPRLASGARAAALGTLFLALAAGCSGAGNGEAGGVDGGDDGARTSDGGGAASDQGDDSASSDGGGTASDQGEESASSDGGGKTDSAGAAEQLPESADLATEELPVPAEDAVAIAVEAAGGGEPVSVEIDHDDDRGWVWEIEVAIDGLEHELDVDGATGEVLEHDKEDDAVDDPTVDVTDPLPAAEAVELALQKQDGRVSGWQLDSDDGRVRYQIDIERPGNDEDDDDDVEVEIDVETREVTVDS